MSERQSEHRFYRLVTISSLWIVFAALLAASVVADLFVDRHGVSVGFSAWYGLLSCIALVLLAKGISLYVTRPEDYYDS